MRLTIRMAQKARKVTKAAAWFVCSTSSVSDFLQEITEKTEEAVAVCAGLRSLRYLL
jgi:hypothetical protein